MFKTKNGQISTEYLIIVSFVIFLVIGIAGAGFYYTNQIRDTLKINQLDNFAKKIIHAAESVYYAGEPSRVTIIAYLPLGIKSFEIIENSFVFNISTNSGTSRIAFSSKVPIEGTISLTEGIKKIQLKALEDRVLLINE